MGTGPNHDGGQQPESGHGAEPNTSYLIPMAKAIELHAINEAERLAEQTKLKPKPRLLSGRRPSQSSSHRPKPASLRSRRPLH